MQFSTIIVAIDVSDPDNGRAALARASAIAGPQGRLRLLYVRYHLPSRYSDLLAGDFDAREQEDALAAMRQWCDDLGIGDDQVEIATRRGRVRDEVLAEAERQGADLIVIGSHQPSLSSKLLGSNASAIVHQSPVSVLVVRA
ncbi:universal stress protein [Sphingomonadales bacterium 56]|jgi:universal stress protein G|uniref:universal stress protein n=1 Tax=unclassified Sphingobium TaxID=2611147 RepID=UPI00191B3866|nr:MULTISPECIES: universal stress protein [unclassified Sphingobium]MBY2927341.1 universal stress protein [Sphingomonadales bacterium 56]MBY2957409.1 universal stress protein [Sphingomonadales bacterium 58]CAD7334997.1 Universal stress protein UP12 [Sphingobium sp. S8]CAD7335016.1 Universal stress protein UP12 [Sphingobium sp. S6]